MDSPFSSYTLDFSDICDLDESTTFWDNFSNNKRARALQECNSKTSDSLCSKGIEKHHFEKSQRSLDVAGSILGVSKYEQKSDGTSWEELEVLDQDKFGDVLKENGAQGSARIGGEKTVAKPRTLYETELSCSKTVDPGKSKFQDKAPGKCDEDFWYFLKCATDMLDSSMSKTGNRNKVSPLKGIVTRHLKERQVKGEENIWYFLPSADKSKSPGKSRTNEPEVKNIGPNDTVESKSETVEKLPDSTTKTENDDGFWYFLESTENPLAPQTGETEIARAEMFEKVKNEISRLENLETIAEPSNFKEKQVEEIDKFFPVSDKSLCIETNCVNMNKRNQKELTEAVESYSNDAQANVKPSCFNSKAENDEFWDFLETDDDADCPNIQKIIEELDFKKDSHTHMNLEKEMAGFLSNVSTEANNNFWDFLKTESNVEVNSDGKTTKPSEVTETNRVKISTESREISSKASCYAKVSTNTIVRSELNIRRKRNLKVGTQGKKDFTLRNNSLCPARYISGIESKVSSTSANNNIASNQFVTGSEMTAQIQLPLQNASTSDSGNRTLPQTIQPIITSVFTIPSWPNIAEPVGDSLQSSNESSNNFLRDCLIIEDDGVDRKISSSHVSETFSANVSKVRSASDCPSPHFAKKQAGKRAHPDNSPKNSVFKITDCDSNVNTGTESSSSFFINGKRNRPSDPNEAIKFPILQEVSNMRGAFSAPIFFPNSNQAAAPLHSKVPKAQVPASACQYVILQQGQLQTPESYVLINIDDSSNAVLRVPVSDAKGTMPVLQYSGVDPQLNKPPENLNCIPQVVTLGLPAPVNAANLQNFYTPAVVYKSSLQSSENDKKHLNAPCRASINVLCNPVGQCQAQRQFVPTTIAAVENSKPTIPKVNLPVISVIKNVPYPKLKNGMIPVKVQSKPFTQPSATMPSQLKCKPTKLKPIKTISIGNDRNAILQTSYPVTVESLSEYQDILGSKSSSRQNIILPNFNTLTGVHETNPKILEQDSSKNAKPTNVFNFTQSMQKQKLNTLMVEKNIISNACRLVNKNIFIKAKQNSSSQCGTQLSATAGKPIIVPNCENKQAYTKPNAPTIATPVTRVAYSSEFQNCTSKEQPHTSAPVVTLTSKNALDALRKLFPPPISMVPVCLVPPLPNANPSTASKVLVLPSPIAPVLNEAKHTSVGLFKKPVFKAKKEARKTVRELLQEKYGSLPDNKVSNPRIGDPAPKSAININNISFLRNVPVSNGPPVSAQFTREANPYKRPNILLLPSAGTLDLQSVGIAAQSSREVHGKPSTEDFTADSTFVSSSDEKEGNAKDYKPRHYDMCGLSIGHLMVEDFADSSGHFQSKFKVFFVKRRFIYDFPVSKSNQVDMSASLESSSFVRIIVPFQIIKGMNTLNRRIELMVKSPPEIYLWKIDKAKTDSTLKARNVYSKPSDNSLWLDIMNNSMVHKISLRQRQADNLRIQLCEVDPEMASIFDVGASMGLTIVDATPFEEEILSVRLRKIPKSKNTVRRLPQWDTQFLSESPVQENEGNLLSTNHVCSCRISCRTLRCSCVKAARACGTGGTNCTCSNCDNPLNILLSLKLDVELCLKDRCLFQNVYQIPNLRSFLDRIVKLSCCSSVVRVRDCVPSTLLCPNPVCNACLEFSWCRRIVCYPERNPRKHCSYCGQCCFSNGRHCLVCNRCYTANFKHPECPTCKKGGVSPNLVSHDSAFEDNFCLSLLSAPEETPATSRSAEPEIVLLEDNSLGAQYEDSWNFVEKVEDDFPNVKKSNSQNLSRFEPVVADVATIPYNKNKDPEELKAESKTEGSWAGNTESK